MLPQLAEGNTPAAAKEFVRNEIRRIRAAIAAIETENGIELLSYPPLLDSEDDVIGRKSGELLLLWACAYYGWLFHLFPDIKERAYAQRTGAAVRESLRRDRPGGLTPPAFHACGSASPFRACCCLRNQKEVE